MMEGIINAEPVSITYFIYIGVCFYRMMDQHHQSMQTFILVFFFFKCYKFNETLKHRTIYENDRKAEHIR